MAMQKQNYDVGESIEANLKCSSQHEKDMLGSPEDIKQWEEARCPVCLEHPHNAVLLRCSSYGSGCRPFMCNTSSHHSNCLDQFRKSHEPSLSSFILPGIHSGQTDTVDGESEHLLTCPLCRGQVYGWYAIQPAREFMNSKIRSCSTETCNFTGNYMELRKHARSDHPSIRPSVVDPERQRNWTRLESETHLSNLLSMFPSNLGLDGNEEEEETMILDEIETEDDNNNVRFAAGANVGMLDDILCLDSLVTYLEWLMTRRMNYFRNNLNERLPPNDISYNYRGRNRVRNNNFISRQNNRFRERYENSVRLNNVNNNLNPRHNNSSRGRIHRNNRDHRHNNVNNNMIPRQNNRVRGSNTLETRDTRPNNSARNDNWRNGYNSRGNISR